jgi:hypothetical protein
MRRINLPATIVLLAFGSTHCKSSEAAVDSTTVVGSASEGLDCNHDLRSNAIARHTWPYPAEYRDLRWMGPRKKVQLKLKPVHAAFVTATVTWKAGDVIRVEDSEVHVTKPRRLIAKRDLVVRRKVWEQGIQVERDYLVAKAGEVASFLLYNSRGLCMVGTDDGPVWMPCDPAETFEGLSEANLRPCEEHWWVKVQRRKLDKGWMLVDLALMERVPPAPSPTR